MATRCSTGTAAQNILIAHELAVVFAERPRRHAITWIRRVGATRPFPDIAKDLVKVLILRRSVRRNGGRYSYGPGMKDFAFDKISFHWALRCSAFPFELC